MSFKGDWSRVKNHQAYADTWERTFGKRKRRKELMRKMIIVVVVASITLLCFVVLSFAESDRANQLIGYYKQLDAKRAELIKTLDQVNRELIKTEGRIAERSEIEQEQSKKKKRK